MTPKPAISLEQAVASLTSAEARIKELNDENKKHRLAAKQAEDEKTKAEEAAKLEQGKYKELYETEKTEHAKTKAELDKLLREKLLREVADEAKLPPELAARLRGETKEELMRDAQELLKILPKRTAPSDGNKGGGAPAGRSRQQQIDEEIARRRGAYQA